MLPDEKIGCHRTGFTRKCRDLVASGECCRFVQFLGKNPNTGDDMNKWDCVDNWGPMLTVENSMLVNQAVASIQSFRNEAVKFSAQLARLGAQQRDAVRKFHDDMAQTNAQMLEAANRKLLKAD